MSTLTVSVCRVCLASNLKMHAIANTQLQPIYEKLSGIKLITEDGKPDSICYLCFSHLRKCLKFKEMSCKTEKVLSGIFHKGVMITQEKFLMLDGGTPCSLSMSATKFFSMPEYVTYENPEVFIKEEVPGLKERMSVTLQTNKGNPVTGIPVEYNASMKILSPKQELHAPEFDENSLNCSYMSAANQVNKMAKSPKRRNKEQITKIRRKHTNAKTSDTKEKPPSNKYSNIDLQKFNNKKHMVTNTDVKPFTCVHCIETFSNKCDLKKHILGHTEKTLHICDVCEKSFSSKYSLKLHIAQKHRIHTAKMMHDCDRCNKSFNHRGTLRLHMRIHTGDKPYACDICPKTFSQKGTLQRHTRMHSGDKPYACDKCTKTFNQESSLKRHIKMHNGVKPYVCTRCDKAYYESSHLTRHIRTHTGEKPYACDRCFQTFSQSSNLQAHMKKHTGQIASNYACYECNKTFDHKSIFKRHLLKHTREKPFPCNRCDKKYADKRTLQRHIVTHNIGD